MAHSTESSRTRRGTQRTSRPWADVHLEPVPRLEWSLATEGHPRVSRATSPAALRCSWIHHAPESQVLDLFRKLGGVSDTLPAPWWLRALDREALSTRKAGFDIEDEVHAVLGSRRGWVFVPWVHVGETGYWEYVPSDREPMKAPTTVVLTDRHPGWVDVIPAHADDAPLPLQVDKAAGLLSLLPRVESW